MRALGLVLLGSLLACSRAPSGSDPDAGVAESASSTLDRARALARSEEIFDRVLAVPAFVRNGDAFATGSAASFGANAPRFADGAWSVHATKHEPITLRTPLHAREGALVEGKVVYRDVADATDLVVSAVEDRLELFYVLRDARAPRRFSLRVEGASPRAEINGGIALEGTGLRVAPAFAIDARGTRRPARLSIDANTIDVEIDTAGLEFPVLLDPAVDQVSWEDVTPVPVPPYTGTSTPARIAPPSGFARTLGSAVYAEGVVYVYGGTYYNGGVPGYGFASTMYEWNGSAWTSAGVGPSFPFGPANLARRIGGLAYDSARKRLVYIGGVGFGPSDTHLTAREYDVVAKAWVGSVCDDGSPCYDTMPASGSTPSVAYAFGRTYVVYSTGTYYWDAPVRALKKIGGSDHARSGAGLAFDSNRNRLVAFGGDGGQTDTREFDGTNWTTIAAATPPPASAFPVLAYDSTRKRTVYLADNGAVYSYDGAAWSLMSASGVTPGGRRGAAFAYDELRGRLVMMGGGTNGGGDPPNNCVDRSPMGNRDLNRDYRVCNMVDAYVGTAFGGDCSTARPCAPGLTCVDGVCCATACSGACQRCDATPGTCTIVTSAVDPDTCTGGSVCNSAGSCRKLDGQACSGGAECLSNNCIDGVCCDTACGGACGACNLPGNVGRCSPLPKGAPGKGCGTYLCGGTGTTCATTCAGDADCASSAWCSAGTCVAASAIGAACTRDRQCLGGRCADGFCCDGACGGPCDVCAASLGASANGTCTILPKTSTTSACGAFTCSGTSSACASSCTTDADCSSGGWCLAGACVSKKGRGESCERTDQCASGLTCADGVCCNEACDGACRACSAINKQSGDKSGECGPAREATNPGGRCVRDDVTTCGLTGLCDAAGSCAKYAAGTGCGASGSTTCDAGVVKGQTCDGLGTCRIDTAGTSCAPGACKDGACSWACADDSGCSSGAWCDAGRCREKGKSGVKCAAGTQCESGFCADGVCCNAACSGSCEACDVVGALGTCTPIVGAPRDGHPKCADADPSNPCSARSCDGVDRTTCARFAGTEVVCRSESCTAEVATVAATCDGKGGCPDAITQACQPYGCGDTKCKTTCSSDSDCKLGFVCDVAKGACTAGATCTGSVVKQIDGTTTDCAPYTCESTGKCKETCAVSSDCVAPAICNAGTCAAPDAAVVEEGGGCSTSSARGGSAFAIACIALAFLSRSRRRSA